MSEEKMYLCTTCQGAGVIVKLVQNESNKKDFTLVKKSCPVCSGKGIAARTERLLSPEEQEIVNLEILKADVIKPYYERRAEAIKKLVEKYGKNHIFQDSKSGVVFEIGKIKGKWIDFEDFIINRTKLSTERAGTITEKKCLELGFKPRFPENLTHSTVKIEDMPYLKPTPDKEEKRIGGIKIT